MPKLQTQLSVNLWNDAPVAAEQLSARIRAVAPLAAIETLEPMTGRRCLWVSVTASDTDAITALLHQELETSVYSYHWYQPEVKESEVALPLA